MADLLGTIVSSKRREVRERKQARPAERLRIDLAPSERSFKEALARRGTRFILELKHISPAEGKLRADFDPRALAAAYSGIADALSVLTDNPFFGGRHEYLQQARQAFDGPILMKDFVVDSYQVLEARTHGADAVLLMLSVLDDREATRCLELAASLEMDCLVEVHTAEELERALHLDAPIVGINHRDLKTLDVDLDTSQRLAPLVPHDRLLVAESGIRSRSQAKQVGPRVDALLVGSALMKTEDPRQAAKALVFGRVKVCGLTGAADLELTERAGASFGGLVFAQSSPRRLRIEQAEALAVRATLPLVGVFQDQPAREVASIAERARLSVVQLHGDESSEQRRELKRLLPGVPIWQALRIRPEDGASEVAARLEGKLEAADRLLVDGPAPGRGRGFEHDVLSRVAELDERRASLMLAGACTRATWLGRMRWARTVSTCARALKSPPGASPAPS